MATIIIKGVKFVSPPAQNQTLTIKYRQTGDADVPASYTVVGTGFIAAADGTISPNVIIGSLLDNTSYTVVITNNCSGRSVSKVVITQDLTTFIWVEDTFVCEQNALITKILDYTGFSSPNKLFYDEVSKRIYCVDSDSGSGNIFWFDPTSFTGLASVTFSTAVTGHQIYDGAIDFDPIRRRIYMAGLATNGLLVYDIATDALIGNSVELAYGNNTSFDRLFVKNIDDFIYCSSRTASTFKIINANSLLSVSNNSISSVSFGTESLTNSYNIFNVNGERWVIAAAGRQFKNIYTYNSTFTTAASQIVLASSVAIGGWGGSLYWGDGFFDQVNNKFYLADIGSGLVYIIDGTTKAIIKTITFNNNKENKLYAQVNFSFDKNVGRLYLYYTAYNSPTDVASSVKRRTYIIRRDTLDIDSIYIGLTTSSLVPQTGTPFVWSANRGLAIWDGGSTWSSDGIITKLSY